MSTTANPALACLPETRRSILEILKQEGEARVEDIAARTGITVSGVRQHLNALASDGLVDRRSAQTGRGGQGRPAHAWRLTEAGESFFPRAYGDLTLELLDYVDEADPELVAKVFERRGRRRVAGAKSRLAGLELGGKVAELTRILDEDGYVASWERTGDGWRITEHNCAILAVALRYGNACGSEIAFIRKVLPEARVERERHIVDGDHVCAYGITPR